jgi:halocyanin-like protein
MTDQTVGRRDVLRVTGLAAAAAVAGCSGGGGGTDTEAEGGGEDRSVDTDSATATTTATESGDGSKPSFDGWLSDVDNYDAVVDETGTDAVSVKFGVDNGGQPYGFGPAAIKVSSGTEVTWEWTGKGSSHNVLDQGGAFESELVAEEGHTFSYTFESSGTYEYSCQPHKALGMKGVVVVE